ncbi:substrate-binding domain-containing protein [Methylosinus sp. Sm6]|uniref:substrate-binding domain-containing protein n=1 Tax=Methylosinus sp. Sm6 TaxID=2866948 RepID=UPI001C99FEE0|nr:substrate-binding domain-containing protein [Methylosinus sp. Sm6]MBY6240839.1 substrate-binding domain-containing protein [Methylosinus sp. Sm6]
MLRNKTMALAGGVSAACLLWGAPGAHATDYAIYVGVAANFNATVLDIINKYKAYHNNDGNTYTFYTTSDSTGNLRAAILAGGTATTAPYDLFLSADVVSPSTVASAGLGMVVGTVTQTPFFYATGSLVLAAQSVDIASCPTPGAGASCGLPTTGSSVYTNFVIADPSKAPYGAAARTVINQAPWSLGLSTATTFTYPPATFPASYVHTSANIGTTFYAVNKTSPAYAYGFVAKSQVCNNGALGSASGGSFKITKAFEYVHDGSSSPNFGHGATTPQTYSKIVQNGIAIERQQSADLKTVVIDFKNYILGGGNGQGTTLRTKYCYGTTP